MLHRHYSHLTARSQTLREALGKVRRWWGKVTSKPRCQPVPIPGLCHAPPSSICIAQDARRKRPRGKAVAKSRLRAWASPEGRYCLSKLKGGRAEKGLSPEPLSPSGFLSWLSPPSDGGIGSRETF